MEQTKEEEFWNTLTHFIGLLLSLGGLPVLLYYDQSQTALSSYSLLFFGFGLILIYAASTVYHFTSNFKLKEKFRVLENNKTTPNIRNFFEKAKNFWKN